MSDQTNGWRRLAEDMPLVRRGSDWDYRDLPCKEADALNEAATIVDRLEAENAKLKSGFHIRDLAMLLSRLIVAHRRQKDITEILSKAENYLKREGLAGDVMRASDAALPERDEASEALRNLEEK